MAGNRTWFNVSNKTADTADVEIYDEIGGFGVSAREFIKGLRDLDGKHLNLRINSPGGSIIDGQAIIAALSRHKAGFTAWVDGLAASMASVIACAAPRCYMAEGAMMMIHRASTVSYGDAADLRKDADLLEKFEKSLVSVYEKKTRMEREELEKMLAAETWMDSLEAVALGFADGITENSPAMAKVSPEDLKARFDTFAKNMSEPEISAEPVEPLKEEEEVVLDPVETTEEVVSLPAEPVAKIDAESITAKIDALKSERDSYKAKVEALTADIANAKAERNSVFDLLAKLERSLGVGAAVVVPVIEKSTENNPRELTHAQFSQLSHPERSAFMRAGGKLI